MFGNLNPFEMPGPQFLQLYTICLVIVSAITITWRLLQRNSRSDFESTFIKPPNVWELAYLRGGKAAIAETAVVALSCSQLVVPIKGNRRLIATSLRPDRQLHPIPSTIYRAAQSTGGIAASKLHKEIAFLSQRIRDGLVDRGYLKTWSDRIAEVWPGYVGFGLLTTFGLSRIWLGIYRDKPVFVLVLLLLVTVVIGLVLTYTRLLTSAGELALQNSIADIRQQQAKATSANQSVAASSDVPMATLATWSFAAMGLTSTQSMLDPGVTELIKKHTRTHDGSGGGTGCSGGDGGGDGGGCGGGGCGGCGG